MKKGIAPPLAGLASAALFGAGAPLAKLLLGGDVTPFMLAGLLYTASGLALAGWRLLHRTERVRLHRRDLLPLSGAVILGGMAGPVLLMVGLAGMPASGASLLLNAEGILTALIAWIVFREATSTRVVVGFLMIALGAVVLSWPGQAQFTGVWPALALLGACLCWGIDNNLTRQVALTDATWLASAKGLVAGPANLVIAVALGATFPGWASISFAAAIGVLAYGVSLVLFIKALAGAGTARAGAYFSVAPFFGAALAVTLGEPLTLPMIVAAVLMAAGVGLHLTEHHEHNHTHLAISHNHWHSHDDGHHDHSHDPSVLDDTWHRHLHDHAAVVHAHPHYPDAHHRHTH